MSDIEDGEISVEINDELLISLVQAHPCFLYAKSDKNYKNSVLKDIKWEEIANILNCTVSEARKRWDSLRNQFCRKRRQQKNQPSGSGTSAEWPLMSCMSFLISHIQNRK
ncbi:PREDICTED: transcription factor Adf-1-like [Vollenhovia emeryi]|uniref:transcription factor Adf-1-like n=1 Tax=Vollenhovia emeryi TaxID=411798 RepID=UPI0005F4089C|nr:PREDICTED: transcription factor Adf-1-like [Vollenhovia emeryi]